MESWTITYCDCGENHVGNQQIGEKAKKGISIKRLKKASKKFSNYGLNTELIDLSSKEFNNLSDDKFNNFDIPPAMILVVRNGLSILLGEQKMEDLEKELKNIETDKKYFDTRRKKVLNKHARHNVCFGEENQEPDYENKKGRIVAFNDVKSVNEIRKNIPYFFGKKYKNIIAELNHYYDVKKTGIGFHGDTERRWVFGAKIGEEMKLCYQWYQHGKPVGDRMDILLKSGDFYVMSEKAVGFDWKKSKNNLMTLRHASGCDKYIVK